MFLPIGDFAKMTYLSIKALRHYHDIGLLVPADIDAETSYRRYRPDQVPAAQVIRRLRDLGMPLGDIGAVLAAPDPAARNAGIGDHLRRMEKQLERTQATVASLRRLLEESPAEIAVTYRTTDPERVLAVAAEVTMDDSGQWWSDALDALHAALADSALLRSGADGALYSPEYFQAGVGEVTAFIPVADQPGGLRHPMRVLDLPGRVPQPVRVLDLPRAELAVAVHRGPYDDLDTTYGALGAFVAERAIGVDGPIRENYLVSPYDTPDEARHITEVCWPVFLTTPTLSA